MNNTKARVLKNTGAYTLVGMIPYLTSFIMLPIYTRYMSPDDYGILSLVSAFQAILATTVSLQLSAALPRYYFEYSGKELKIFFSTTMYSVVGIAATFLVAIHFIGGPLVGFIFPKADIPYFPYFFICLVTVFIAQSSQVAQMLLVVQERGGAVLFRAILGTFFGIAAGLYFVVYLDMKALGALLAGVLGGFFVMALNMLLVKEFFVLKWRKRYFIQSLKYGWPIIPHAMGGYLFMYSDKIVMEKFVALSAIGIYSIADRLSMSLKMLVNSINTALTPNFTRLATRDIGQATKTFKPIITKWAVLVSFFYLGLAMFSRELIEILTPEQYHAAYPLVPILLAAYIFRGLYCFGSYPLFFLKKTKYIPMITFTAGFANVGLNILFIPMIGIQAAAWTTLAAFFITFVLAFYFSSKLFSMQVEWLQIVAIFAVMFFIFAMSMLFLPEGLMSRIFAKLVYLALFGMIIYIKNWGDVRKEIFGFFPWVQMKLARQEAVSR